MSGSRSGECRCIRLKTPLAPDVNFRVLAERYAVSGGDIKNAVLKAATTAASEAGPDSAKTIRQSHFERAMEEVDAGEERDAAVAVRRRRSGE